MLKTRRNSPKDICHYRRAVAEVISDLSLKHDITISVAVKAKTQFEKYAKDLPYYQNILREGIRYGGGNSFLKKVKMFIDGKKGAPKRMRHS